MYINEDFLKAITHSSPRIAFKMELEEEVITSENDGLMIDAPWEFISDGFMGQFPSTKIKASFLYIGDKKSYINKRIKCHIGAYSFDDETSSWGIVNWLQIGIFTVPEDGQVTDEIMHKIELTMYDDAVTKLDKRYEAVELPISGVDLINGFSTKYDVPISLEQKDLTYDNYVFDGLNISENQDISVREVIRQYAQLNMASAYINRYGELIIKSVFEGVDLEDGLDNYDYSTMILEPVYGPLNSLIYSNKAGGTEESYQDIESKDENSILANGKKSIEFSNNLFLDSMSLEVQQIEIEKLFLLVNGFSYTPFEVNYFPRPDFDPYDRIIVKDMDGNPSMVPITTMTFNYNGGLLGTLSTKELPETLPKPVIPNIFERVTNAEIRVDRAENKITGVVSDVEYLGEEVYSQGTLTEQLKDELRYEVSERIQQGDDIREETKASTSLLKDEFTLEFSRIDGSIDEVSGDLNEWKTTYQLNEDGATIGKNSSPLQITISNEQISFLDGGSATAWINGQMMYIRSLHILESIIIGHHQFIKYDGVQKSTLLKPTGSGEL